MSYTVYGFPTIQVFLDFLNCQQPRSEDILSATGNNTALRKQVQLWQVRGTGATWTSSQTLIYNQNIEEAVEIRENLIECTPTVNTKLEFPRLYLTDQCI